MRVSEPLDFNHPLWTMHIIEKYEGGAAVVLRWHHAMADGVALIGVTMALVDGPVGRARRPPPPDEDEGLLQTLMAPVVAAVNAGTQASTSTLRRRARSRAPPAARRELSARWCGRRGRARLLAALMRCRARGLWGRRISGRASSSSSATTRA